MPKARESQHVLGGSLHQNKLVFQRVQPQAPVSVACFPKAARPNGPIRAHIKHPEETVVTEKTHRCPLAQRVSVGRGGAAALAGPVELQPAPTRITEFAGGKVSVHHSQREPWLCSSSGTVDKNVPFGIDNQCSWAVSAAGQDLLLWVQAK